MMLSRGGATRVGERPVWKSLCSAPRVSMEPPPVAAACRRLQGNYDGDTPGLALKSTDLSAIIG